MLDLMAVLSCYILTHKLPKSVTLEHVSGKVAKSDHERNTKDYFMARQHTMDQALLIIDA